MKTAEQPEVVKERRKSPEPAKAEESSEPRSAVEKVSKEATRSGD
jgi:hypothetical protein